MADYRRENVELVNGSDKLFTYSERHRGRNRDIYIKCETDDTDAVYKHADREGPLQLDGNWYENNIAAFYDSLAEAIATAYIANGNVWIGTVNVRIHRTNYQYNLS